MIEIVEVGILTTIQDRGRPGYAEIGVSPSGAVDRALAARCNRLVGNAESAAVLETAGGLRVRAVDAAVVAVDSEPSARVLRAGEEVTIAVGGHQWHYMAVRGGISVEPVLGSRAIDTMGGLGPPRPIADQRLPIGPEPDDPVSGEVAPVREIMPIARVRDGPRTDWFTADSLEKLTTAAWTITDASRVGVRLSGPTLERLRTDELPSEGLVRGAIQVPPDGNLVMMLADHPTTGGYPVIAVVQPADVTIVAQRLTGTTVRFKRR